MWLACHTQEEIAKEVSLSQPAIVEEIESIIRNGNISKTDNTLAIFQETDKDGNPLFDTPLYNVWAFARKTNNTSHFGIRKRK